MNIIQLAKAQVAAESSSGQGRVHSPAAKKRGVTLVDGELEWLGEFTDPKESRPCKVANGDKQVMTSAEQKLFARTPYERGITQYHYEGSLRIVRPGYDSKDPRHSYREGQGVFKYPHGELYEGSWKMNRRSGPGYMSTPKGYRFQGEWKDDVPHGKGHETFSTRSAFDAEYDGRLPEGPGVLLYSPNTGYRYEGEFKNGRRHGKGTIFYDNGDVFVGTFDQGKRHGRGVTTTRARGKEIQYETEWDQDVLTTGPSVIEKSKRTRKPKSEIKYNVEGMAPADLTKWKVKDDVTELPMEHFLRIKLGFELLDLNGSGSLSTNELTAIWGTGSLEMLKKLDTDGNGTVELDEIFAGWYPERAPPQHQPLHAARHQPEAAVATPRVPVRGSRRDGQRLPAARRHPQPGVRRGPRADAQGTRMPRATRSAVRSSPSPCTRPRPFLCDPFPHFLEVLEAWYPNIPRSTLIRYELAELPPGGTRYDPQYLLHAISRERRTVDSGIRRRAGALARRRRRPRGGRRRTHDGRLFQGQRRSWTVS